MELSSEPPQVPALSSIIRVTVGSGCESLSLQALELDEKYAVSGDADTLKEAIKLHRSALDSCPEKHPNRGDFLYNLATALLKLQREGGRDSDTILTAIQFYREALQLRPFGHPLHELSLDALASALVAQFQEEGGLEKLDEAVELQKEVLEHRPEGHPLRYAAFRSIFRTTRLQGKILQDSQKRPHEITRYRALLEQRPHGHPLREFTLHNLARAIWLHYRSHGEGDLLEAIDMDREALELRPIGHPLRLFSLDNLANKLQNLFVVRGDEKLLLEAIDHHRSAVSLCPLGHPHRPHALSNLGLDLWSYFERFGREEYLSEALAIHREAVSLGPLDDISRGYFLSNVGSCLVALFRLNEDEQQLEEAVTVLRESLALRPPGNSHREFSLNYLAHALVAQFEHCGGKDRLSEAISVLQEAVDTTHPRRRGVYVHNLADVLWLQYKDSKDKQLLPRIISLEREALSTLEEEHTIHSEAVCNLANALSAQFDASTSSEELSESHSLYLQVLEQRQSGHPERAAAHFAIASMLLRVQRHESWPDALQYLLKATSDPFCPARTRLRLSVDMLRLMEVFLDSNQADEQCSIDALEAYVHTVELLTQAAHLGLGFSSRLRELAGTEDMCRSAAIRAMILHRIPLSIEILEESRATFWMQSIRPRVTNLDSLPTDESEKLHKLLRSLDRGSHDISSNGYDGVELEQRLESQRRLNSEAQEMIDVIRARPGMERFMKIGAFAHLAQAASHGPIVFLLSTDLACFAVAILDTNGASKAISLPGITPGTLHSLRFRALGSGLRDVGEDPGAGDDDSSQRLAIKSNVKRENYITSPIVILGQIWQDIVHPIVEGLGFQRAEGRSRPRIYWCPVGEFAFLPLHAAGVYTGSNQICLSDFVVSSYTPSLSSLIRAHQDFMPVTSDCLQALLVAEASADGHVPLPMVEDEVQMVAALMSSAGVTYSINSAPAVRSVVDALPPAHILHLACHGIQRSNPLESHFVLHDGPLSIATLAQLELPNAVLAFLSACETAKGDKKQPDQAVHLAASMLFCGFRSVIGTMWTMHDEDGPEMARAVYGELLQHQTLRLDDIPYALDHAVQQLRARRVPPNRWATFIHMGA